VPEKRSYPPLKIYAENFRSFPLIDWDLPSGLTLIDGINKDTGGSNMAGKTTLLDAWFWCRYGWLPKWKGPKGGSADAVLRRRNNVVVGSTFVRVEERFGSSTFVIERQRPNRLAVWKDGTRLAGCDQKALEALIGSPERFLVCVYLPQRRQRSFYWMGDNDRTELISIVAGLEDLERAAQDAKAMRDEAKTHIEQVEFAIQLQENQLRELPSRIADLTLKRDYAQAQLQAAEADLHKADMRWDQFSYDAERKSEEDLKAKLGPLLDQLWNAESEAQSWEATHAAQKKQLDNFPPLDPKFQKAVEDAKKKLKEAEEATYVMSQLQQQLILETSLANEAEEGICSQCEQLLPEDKRKEKAQKHRTKSKQLRETLVKSDVPALGEIKKRLDEAEKALQEARSQNDSGPSKLKALLAEFETKIHIKKSEVARFKREIEVAQNEAKKDLAAKKAELYRDVEVAKREVSHHKKAFETAQDTLSLIQGDEAKLIKSISDEDVAIRKWKTQLDQALDLVEVFGPKGYRAVCYEGLIEKISDRAGQLLSLMTQGLYSTRLEQLGQDSKGNQKIILKPVIIRGGSEVPQDDLSGGAEERVALAYDVAVAEAAGEGLPLLMDEVLSALDAVGKTEAMTLLEEVSKSRPVLVIDHASEFKAMFSQVIRVVYENEESRLEVA
jgi:DNA repair exonuclease SbcCD ATPase subunit